MLPFNLAMLNSRIGRRQGASGLNQEAYVPRPVDRFRTPTDVDDVEDEWADIVISHHALEHVDRRLDIVHALFAKLKPGGKIVLVTPSETVAMRFREDDPNFHLFTWSPSFIDHEGQIADPVPPGQSGRVQAGGRLTTAVL